MATMVILVLDDVNKLDDVIDAWRDAGAWGVTVLKSTGAARLAGRGPVDDIPLFPGLDDLLQTREVHHRTLVTVLDDNVDVRRIFDATEAVTGPLTDPATGIMWSIPVLEARGLHKAH